MARLSGVYIYPVKSCAALPQAEAQVQPRGLMDDRRWMVVDAQGRFVTGRQQPRLCLLRARPTADGLRLSAPALPDIELARPHAGRQTVVVWNSEVQALVADAAANDWLSRFLGEPLRLVFQDVVAQRPLTSSHAQPGDEVSFADAFPLLLIAQASLDGLSARLGRPLSMLRFRPNLVVDGVAPHAEDGWRRIRIGEVLFDLAKPCTRCVFTTIDPETAERDPDNEPIRTLLRYRRAERGVVFGMNLIARGQGAVRIGDDITVLA